MVDSNRDCATVYHTRSLRLLYGAVTNHPKTSEAQLFINYSCYLYIVGFWWLWSRLFFTPALREGFIWVVIWVKFKMTSQSESGIEKSKWKGLGEKVCFGTSKQLPGSQCGWNSKRRIPLDNKIWVVTLH